MGPVLGQLAGAAMRQLLPFVFRLCEAGRCRSHRPRASTLASNSTPPRHRPLFQLSFTCSRLPPVCRSVCLPVTQHALPQRMLPAMSSHDLSPPFTLHTARA